MIHLYNTTSIFGIMFLSLFVFGISYLSITYKLSITKPHVLVLRLGTIWFFISSVYDIFNAVNLVDKLLSLYYLMIIVTTISLTIYSKKYKTN